MLWLFLASLIWAFSFGLIKGLISGIDPFVMGFIRMAFAFAVSLLFWRPNNVSGRHKFLLAAAGLFQLGFMYAPYLLSFRYLNAHEVALFTMTTPILVVLIHQIATRTLSIRVILAAMVSIVGGGVIAYQGANISSISVLFGVFLVQIANLLFAWGQFIYARSSSSGFKDQMRGMPYYFGGAFLGSTFVAAIAVLNGSQVRALTVQEWSVLAWLGIVASGLGFAIWNFGVSRVSYGTLAVASDFKLPVAVAVSLVVFGETANPLQLIVGTSILALATFMVRVPKGH